MIWAPAIATIAAILSLIECVLAAPPPNTHLSRRQQRPTIITAEPDDPKGVYCGRYHTTSILLPDGNLWIYGGMDAYHKVNNTGKPTAAVTDLATRQIWEIDLSTSWKTDDGPPLLYNQDLPADIIPRRCGVGRYRQDNQIFIFGGDRSNGSDQITPPRVYTFDIDIAKNNNKANPWSFYPVENLNSRICGSTAQDGDSKGYYLGGFTGVNDNPTATRDYIYDDMIQFPLGAYQSSPAIAKNISNNNLNQFQSSIAGTMTYIESIGKKGIFVAIGGSQSNTMNVDWKWPANVINFNDMNDIAVFDIDAQVWHRQRAEGDVTRRRLFCTILQSAPDKSSHHLYVYGGEGPTAGDPAPGDIWVLSIPAFKWTKVDDTRVDAPRKEHGCQAVNRQMLVIGGNVLPSVEKIKNEEYDPRTCAAAMWHVFDTVKHEWTDSFDAKAQPYEVNSDLVAAKATVKEPVSKWSNEGVKALFAQTASTTRSSTSSTTTPSALKKNKVAPIAGGVVGGIALLALIGLAAFLIHKRKYGRDDQPSPPVHYDKAPVYDIDAPRVVNSPAAELPVHHGHGQHIAPAELSSHQTRANFVELPGHSQR